MKSLFICPVCGKTLDCTEKSYFCSSGHTFDRAKCGYVNLLMSQSSVKNHGDDKAMIAARTRFLESGYYSALRDAVVGASSVSGGVLLDAACGDGYYSHHTASAVGADLYGIDISADALKACAKRGCPSLAVASLFRIPMASESVDIILNIFAPECMTEFSRVLKRGGILVKVVPLERHLFELKAAVYDRPWENDVLYPPEGALKRVSVNTVEYSFALNGHELIMSLFNMTPYSRRTGSRDLDRLAALNSINLTAAFGIAVYKKP